MNPSTFLLLFSLSFCTQIFGMEIDNNPTESDNNLVYSDEIKERVLDILEICNKNNAIRDPRIRNLIFRLCGNVHYHTLTAHIPKPHIVDLHKIHQQHYNDDRVECYRLYPFTRLHVGYYNTCDCKTDNCQREKCVRRTFADCSSYYERGWNPNFVTLSSETTRITWNYKTHKWVHYHKGQHWHDRKEVEKEREQIVNKDTTIKNISHVEEPTIFTVHHGALTFHHISSKDNSATLTIMCNAMALINHVTNAEETRKKREQEEREQEEKKRWGEALKKGAIDARLARLNDSCQSSLPCVIL